MIDTRKLGGLTVSDICLGTMTFGKDTPKDEALAQMDRAIGAGITFWDTAEMYPVNPVTAEAHGRTESIIGAWLESLPALVDVLVARESLPLWYPAACFCIDLEMSPGGEARYRLDPQVRAMVLEDFRAAGIEPGTACA